MSQTAIPKQRTEPTELNAAFAALQSYDHGSSRAKLLPLDEAVVAIPGDTSARKNLERRLIVALNSGCPVTAQEYICSKLALIGTERCVPALIATLNVPEVSTAARNVLEAIPGSRATKALRDSLPRLNGVQKAGVINSLGVRRDTGSIGVLSALLNDADSAVVSAAIAALGEIGSARAAKMLREFQPGASESLRQKMADACLVCAEHLLAAGKRADAETLYRMYSTTAHPKHVQLAAVRGLERTADKR